MKNSITDRIMSKVTTFIIVTLFSGASFASAQMPMPTPAATCGEYVVDVQGLATAHDGGTVAYTIIFNRIYVKSYSQSSRSNGILTDGADYYYSYGSVQYGVPATGSTGMVQDVVLRLNSFNPIVRDMAWPPRFNLRPLSGAAMNFVVKIPAGYHYVAESAAILQPYYRTPMLPSIETWAAPPTVVSVPSDDANPSVLTLQVVVDLKKSCNEIHVITFAISKLNSMSAPRKQGEKPGARPQTVLRGWSSEDNPLFPYYGEDSNYYAHRR